MRTPCPGRKPSGLYAAFAQGTKKRKCSFLPLTKSRTIPIFTETTFLEMYMINLSDAARQELEAFFADKPRTGIRIYLAPGG